MKIWNTVTVLSLSHFYKIIKASSRGFQTYYHWQHSNFYIICPLIKKFNEIEKRCIVLSLIKSCIFNLELYILDAN